MRSIQIAVIGSCSDLNFTPEAEKFAQEVGEQIASQGAALVFGAEKDIGSLPTIAVREICALMERVSRGAYAARCAIETAVLDALSQIQNVPAVDVLGGVQSAIRLNAVIGLSDGIAPEKQNLPFQPRPGGQRTPFLHSPYHGYASLREQAFLTHSDHRLKKQVLFFRGYSSDEDQRFNEVAAKVENG